MNAGLMFGIFVTAILALPSRSFAIVFRPPPPGAEQSEHALHVEQSMYRLAEGINRALNNPPTLQDLSTRLGEMGGEDRRTLLMFMNDPWCPSFWPPAERLKRLAGHLKVTFRELLDSTDIPRRSAKPVECPEELTTPVASQPI